MNSVIVRRRASSNAAFSAAAFILPFLVSLATTPLLVHGLGDEFYGVYALVLGFINYAFTYGIGKAAAKYVAEYRAAGKLESVNESISTALWLSLLLGAASTAVIFLFTDSFLEFVLRIPPDLFDEGRRALQLAGAIIFVYMLTQVWTFTLQGLHQFDKHALISATASVALNVGAVLIVMQGYGLSAVLWWNLLAAVLMAVSFAASAKLSLPSLHLTLQIRPQIRRSVVNYGTAVMLSQIFGNILLIFERTLITRLFGVDALTYYVVPMTPALLLHSFIGSILIVLFPLVNERLSDMGGVAGMYRTATKFVLAFAGFALVSSAFLGKAFLTVWIGEGVAARSTALLVIHTATFGILAAATMAWNVAESFEKLRINVIFCLFWLFVGGILMMILGPMFGLEGVAAARLIGVLGVLPLAVFVERQILGTFRAGYWALTFGRLFVASAATAIVQGLVSLWTSGTAALAIGIVTGAGAYLLILWAAGYLTKDELAWLRRSNPLGRA
jgi:O-antigen/teichoic acid export membrane protein